MQGLSILRIFSPWEGFQLSNRVEFVPLNAESLTPKSISDLVYGNFRSYKKDKCAIFTDNDDIRRLLSNSSLAADVLDDRDNFRWTGANRNYTRKYRRIVAGDYLDWFCWYMKWRRFNAFHLLIWIRPIGRMIEDERRGFIDGLLTRLVSKGAVHKIVIIEEERFRGIVTSWLGGSSKLESPELAPKFRAEEFKQAMLTVLFGSTLARARYLLKVKGTLTYKIYPEKDKLLRWTDNGWFFERSLGRKFWSLSEEGDASVLGLSIYDDVEKPKPEKWFEPAGRRRHVRSDEKWLEGLIETHLLNTGWFTMPDLYKFVDLTMEEARKRTDHAPDYVDPDLVQDYKIQGRVSLPSEAILRRLVGRMVTEGKLKTTTWFHEMGRPSTVYYGQDRPPFKEGDRCGQCAFHISVRRQCRLWWLLGKSFGPRDPRWDSRGDHPLNAFELYKMKNAWRISPHSSACMRFVDKKKDYSLKHLPETCDICAQSLPTVSRNLIFCGKCRSRYFKTKHSVRVLTSYEHVFQSVYLQLAGRKASSDITRLHEEHLYDTPRILERIDFEKARAPIEEAAKEQVTLMLFPGDKMLTRNGQLFLLGRRNVESVPLAGCTIVDHGVLEDEQIAELQTSGAVVRSVAKSMEIRAPADVRYHMGSLVEKTISTNPELVRTFAVAMAKSAIHATERLGPIGQIPADEIDLMVAEQSRFLTRIEEGLSDRYLSSEALIMRRYWSCYDLALKMRMQRFGPRKKSRFVREHVNSPTGRAKGYSAVDSAINYLHQKRIFKIRQVNSGLGISSWGDGFLHRKRWNSQGLGLVLDLADPLKFADREKLLEAVLNFSVNWRDFNIASDRHGTAFYYPKSEIIATLETLSDDADNLPVVYGGLQLKLLDAYSKSVSSLAEFLSREVASFEPFIF